MEFLNTMDPNMILGLGTLVGIVLAVVGGSLFGHDYKGDLQRLESEKEKNDGAYADNVRVLNAQVEELTSSNEELTLKNDNLKVFNKMLKSHRNDLLELNLELSLSHLDFTKAYTEHIICDKEAAYAYILHLENGGISDSKKLDMLRTLTDDIAIITNGNEEELLELIDPNKDILTVDKIIDDDTVQAVDYIKDCAEVNSDDKQIEEDAEKQESPIDAGCDTCEQTDEEKEKLFNQNREEHLQSEEETTSEDAKKTSDDK